MQSIPDYIDFNTIMINELTSSFSIRGSPVFSVCCVLTSITCLIFVGICDTDEVSSSWGNKFYYID